MENQSVRDSCATMQATCGDVPHGRCLNSQHRYAMPSKPPAIWRTGSPRRRASAVASIWLDRRSTIPSGCRPSNPTSGGEATRKGNGRVRTSTSRCISSSPKNRIRHPLRHGSRKSGIRGSRRCCGSSPPAGSTSTTVSGAHPVVLRAAVVLSVHRPAASASHLHGMPILGTPHCGTQRWFDHLANR